MNLNQQYTLAELLQETNLDKIKDKYKLSSKLTSKDKSKILEEIQIYYDIKYNKVSNTYIPTNYKSSYTPPKSLQTLMKTNEIYQYLVPLIMKKAYSQNETLYFTTSRYAEHLSLVNQRYNELRIINNDKTCRQNFIDELNIQSQTLYEYIDKVDETIKHYIDVSLSKLKGYLQYKTNVKMVALLKTNPITKEAYIDIQEATPEQDMIILRAIEQADNKANIQEPVVINRIISKEFNAYMQEYLNEHGILYTFTAYAIMPIKSNATKNAFNYFNKYNIKELSTALNYKFLQLMNDNAKSRKKSTDDLKDLFENPDRQNELEEKQSEKEQNDKALIKYNPYYEYRLSDDYLNEINLLGTITLLPESSITEHSKEIQTINDFYKKHQEKEKIKLQLQACLKNPDTES